MKKIIFLIAFIFTSLSAFTQAPPDELPDGVKAPFFRADTLTTAQRDALTPILGDLIYHKDTGVSRHESYDGSEWEAFGAASITTFTVEDKTSSQLVSTTAGTIKIGFAGSSANQVLFDDAFSDYLQGYVDLVGLNDMYLIFHNKTQQKTLTGKIIGFNYSDGTNTYYQASLSPAMDADDIAIDDEVDVYISVSGVVTSLPGVTATGTPGSGNYVFEAGENTNDLGIKLDENAGYIYLGTSANPFRIDGAGDAYMVGQFNLTGGLDATGNVSGADATQATHFVTKQQFDAGVSGIDLTLYARKTADANLNMNSYEISNALNITASNFMFTSGLNVSSSASFGGNRLELVGDALFDTDAPSWGQTKTYVQGQLASDTFAEVTLTDGRSFALTDAEGNNILTAGGGNGEINLDIPDDATLDFPDRSALLFDNYTTATDSIKISYPIDSDDDGTADETVNIKTLGSKRSESFRLIKRSANNWYAVGDFVEYTPEAYGAELVDIANLVVSDGTTMTYSGGVWSMVDTQRYESLEISNILTVGKTYKVELTLANYTEGSVRFLGPATAGNGTASNGLHSFEIVATNDDFRISINGTGDNTFDITAISCKEVL